MAYVLTMKKHKLTEEKLRNLLKGDPETVAEIRNLIDPPRVVKWEELVENEGYYVTDMSEIEYVKMPYSSEPDANVFAHESQAIGFGIAAAKLTQVVERAREGWKPKWDGTRDNWCVVLDCGKLKVCLMAYANPFALPTRELTEQFLETCREDLEAYYLAV